MEAMKAQTRPLRRYWLLLVPAVALIAGHATIYQYVSSRAALPAAIVLGVIILAVITHLGLIGSLLAALRRRSRR
jgi:hypothetical protein